VWCIILLVLVLLGAGVFGLWYFLDAVRKDDEEAEKMDVWWIG